MISVKSRRSKSNHAERSNWNYLKLLKKKVIKKLFIYDFEKLIALYRWSLRSLIPENHENTPIEFEPDEMNRRE